MTDQTLAQLAEAELIVPIRTSSGEAPDPERVPVDGMRHGNDEHGRFLAAFSTPELFDEFGPRGSDFIRLTGRDLFERADRAQDRVVVDPGSPQQVEVPVGVLPFLAAGIDPNRPDAMRARSPIGELPPLDPPDEIPEAFAAELRRALEDLPQVERAWLLRTPAGWTVGVQLTPEAVLADFDAVRNRLHAIATEHLGSRRMLAVTDLRAPGLREQYDAVAAPFYAARRSKGIFSRLLGR